MATQPAPTTTSLVTGEKTLQALIAEFSKPHETSAFANAEVERLKVLRDADKLLRTMLRYARNLAVCRKDSKTADAIRDRLKVNGEE